VAHIDWQSGRIDFPSDTDMGLVWSLVVAGDWAPLGEPVPPGIYDLAMVNVEGMLGNVGTPMVRDGPHIHLPETAVEGLVAGSFDLACLANNHSMDFGPCGLAHTQLDGLAKTHEPSARARARLGFGPNRALGGFCLLSCRLLVS
jgi:hypothetical protein